MRDHIRTSRRTKKAAAGRCSDWSGGTSTALLRLNKILDPELVGEAAVTLRHHHPHGELVQLGTVGGKTDRDAPLLRPIFPQRGGHRRVVGEQAAVSPDSQFHAAAVLELALRAEFLELAFS